MPDSSHVGRRYAAPGQVVDAEGAAAFAASVAGTDAAPTGLGAVPPTYAAVYCLSPTLGQIILDPEVGIRLEGMVHGEQEFTWHQPVRAGDTLDVEATIAGVVEKRGRVYITVELEARRAGGGETVVTGRALLLVAA